MDSCIFSNLVFVGEVAGVTVADDQIGVFLPPVAEKMPKKRLEGELCRGQTVALLHALHAHRVKVTLLYRSAKKRGRVGDGGQER